MSRSRLFALLLVILLSALALFGRGGEDSGEFRRARVLMGTVVEITLLDAGAGIDPEAAMEAAFSAMAEVEALMSAHRDDSETAQLNVAAGTLEVSAATAEVLELGLRVAAASAGAFDLTLGRLKALWGFDGHGPRVPSDPEIAAALQGIGPASLRLEGRRVTKGDAALRIDLGAIAKGYAVDRAIAALQAAGVRHASVNAGGDLRLLGDHGGRPWRIGIQHPRDPQGVLVTLELADAAVVTSGDYERFFEVEGVRYHHLLDPRDGRPADACRSVTVVAVTAAEADALATAAFVLGPEAGRRLVEDWGGMALFVAADGDVSFSEALKARVRRP
jgi:thiamine biosynthesis lipoprotein